MGNNKNSESRKQYELERDRLLQQRAAAQQRATTQGEQAVADNTRFHLVPQVLPSWTQIKAIDTGISALDRQEQIRQEKVAHEAEMARRRKEAANRSVEEAYAWAKENRDDIDWNSEDASSIVEEFATPEDMQDLGIAKAVGLSAISAVPTAGMYGWVPAIGMEAGAWGGGYVGDKVMNFVGDAIDSKYGTNTTPYLRFFGGMFGGGLGAGSMYRNTAHITSKLTNIKENIRQYRLAKAVSENTTKHLNSPTRAQEYLFDNILKPKKINFSVKDVSSFVDDPMYNPIMAHRTSSISSSQHDAIMQQIRDAVSKTSKANKLVKDVAQIKSLQTAPPQHNSLENLVYFNKGFSDKSLLGAGVESSVYKMGTDPNYVYKVPNYGFMYNGEYIGGKSIEEMFQNAKVYVDAFNKKYLYQEPLSLVGYTRHGQNGTLLPVFKQRKALVVGEDLIPYFKTNTGETMTTKLSPVRVKDWGDVSEGMTKQLNTIINEYPKNNIFVEYPNLQVKPEDAHWGNWGIYEGNVLRAFDVHKNGGKLINPDQ